MEAVAPNQSEECPQVMGSGCGPDVTDGFEESHLVAEGEKLVAEVPVAAPENAQADRQELRTSFLDKVRVEQPIHLNVDELPSPIFISDVPTVTLGKKALERGKLYCQFSLIGRLDFGKMSILRARSVAAQLWAPVGEWKMIPLGNGFFMLRLESKDDFIRIWPQTWRLGNQLIRFIRCTPDFGPDKHKSANALLWVRFPKLKQQYWDYELLMTLGKGLGTPIGVDQRTISREYGYFANVLVDIDLSKPVRDGINVKEEGGREFFQPVEISKLPAYCNHCKTVGHEITQCRGLTRAIQEPAKQNTNRQDGFQMANNSHRNNIQRRGEEEGNNNNAKDPINVADHSPNREQEVDDANSQNSSHENAASVVEVDRGEQVSTVVVPALHNQKESNCETEMLPEEEVREPTNISTQVKETQFTPLVNFFEILADLGNGDTLVQQQTTAEIGRLVEAQRKGDDSIARVKARLAEASQLSGLSPKVGSNKGGSVVKKKGVVGAKSIASANVQVGIGTRTRQNLSSTLPK